MLPLFQMFAALLLSTAHAQPPSEAQRLVDQARTEVAAGRLPEARDLLQRALTLQPSPTTAFNLGLVLHDLGQLVAARDLLERVLAGEYGTLPADRVTRTQEMIRSITPRIGTLLCTVRGAPETEVWVDGTRAGVALDGAALRIPADPGDHALRFVTTGRDAIERTVTVEPGQVVPLSIALPRVPPPADPPRATDSQVEVLQSDTASRRDRDRGEDEGGSIFASPWFWVAVVAVGAATAGSILLLSTGATDPTAPDGFVGVAATLH